MTRDEALFKLLRLEPATKPELHVVTGWGIEETNDVLKRLMDKKLVKLRIAWRGVERGSFYTTADA